MSFIKTPNLPEKTVTDVIVSGEISPESEHTLNSFGINVHKTQCCDTLYNAVKYHADMVFHHLGDNLAAIEATQTEYFKHKFSALNICSGKRITDMYPHDIAYNAARVGRFLVCNTQYTDKNITHFAENNSLEIIDIKQGYAKCNICVVAENAIITSDIGIKRALGNFPIDVLLIDDSGVLLKDFSHGFFGGTTGKIACDKLAVNGNIKLHNNAEEIIQFAKKYDVEIISLNNNIIEDIGSILSILEK